jgi:hypothetical protein
LQAFKANFSNNPQSRFEFLWWSFVFLLFSLPQMYTGKNWEFVMIFSSFAITENQSYALVLLVMTVLLQVLSLLMSDVVLQNPNTFPRWVFFQPASFFPSLLSLSLWS